MNAHVLSLKTHFYLFFNFIVIKMQKMFRTESLQKNINSGLDLESLTDEPQLTMINNNSEMLLNLERNLSKEKRTKKNKPESSDDEDDEENSEEIENSNIPIDEDEARLENLVFGAEKNIFENMTKNNKKKSGLKFNEFLNTDKKNEIADVFKERKAVWEDENDEEDK